MPTLLPKDHLPPQIDPRKLAATGSSLTGVILFEHVKRLDSAVVGRGDDHINVALNFGLHAEGFLTVSGHATAAVIVQCQRCMQSMDLVLEAPLNLAVVKTEIEAKQLPSDLEPLIVAADKVNTAHMIEEELLLALPFVNYHPTGACQLDYDLSGKAGYSLSSGGAVSVSGDDSDKADDQIGEQGPNKKETPFSILERLKGKLPK